MDKYVALAGEMILQYAPGVLLAVVILFIGLRVIKFLESKIRTLLEKSKMEVALVTFLASLVGWIFKIMLFIAVADMVGVETTSFIALLGAAGLAVGLALQGTLANFAGGVMLMLFKPFVVADRIKSQDVVGQVREIQIFNTILLTNDNKTVIMPNGAIMNNHITNYSREGKLRVDLVVGISYDADIRKAKKVLEEMMQNNPKVFKNPAPMVAVSELGDSSVNLAVRPWCTPDDYWDVTFDILENSKHKLDEASISIPYPQRDIHLYNHK